MRIALVHSFYRAENPSGENEVVLRQERALRAAGHQVLLISQHTDNESQRRLYALRSAMNVAAGTGPDPTAELKAFGPDVVHVHNLFPNFGERWLGRWRQSPVVATLHNFRSVCSNGLLFRDGETCMLCVGGDTRPALKHRCYRESLPATLPLAVRNAGGLGRNRLIRRAERIIVLSERSREVFADAGGDSVANKLVVLPNGIEDRSDPTREANPHAWVFVGRLSAEKGIRELVRAWPEGVPLVVVGDGPLRQQLEASRPETVTFTGCLNQDQVDSVLRSALGLVFPSRWLEGFPTVVAEALMHGVPVIARAGSGGADFIERTGSGVVYAAEEDLVGRIAEIQARFPELSNTARTSYERELAPEEWVRGLLTVYGTASLDTCVEAQGPTAGV